MKTYTYIFLLGATFLGACGLMQDVEDIDPLYVLDSGTVITDAPSAELALNGVYNSYYQGDFMPYMATITSQLGVSSVATPTNPVTDYQRNDIKANDNFSSNIHSGLYNMINRANWVIDRVSALPNTGFAGNRRTEIIGEAKYNRALGHFYLLRCFGQFWDKNSPLGITLKKEPSRSAEIFPRDRVEDVYTYILKDLEEAIAEAPAFRQHYFASSVAAKALKAKVQLFHQDFAGAAATAKQIIDDRADAYELVPTFNEVFAPIPASFNSKEALFSVATNETSSVGMDNLYFFFAQYAISPYVKSLKEQSVMIGGTSVKLDKGRITLTDSVHCFAPNVCFPMNGKFPFPGGPTKSTYFHMRMAEVYLIYAEAEARSGSINNALEALNQVRVRAGADPYPATTTKAEILEAIRVEKVMELATENGEDWFDLIRYETVDPTFMISAKKSTLLESSASGGTEKYVLPFPRSSIDAGLAPNPGY
ncbi:RagB/SusD family nutrient uptake outer membrane protein [Rufibacter hautae]|nr:RagB/SusD family nutrient uptake outer membrane protein [Rufibacter hautae]